MNINHVVIVHSYHDKRTIKNTIVCHDKEQAAVIADILANASVGMDNARPAIRFHIYGLGTVTTDMGNLGAIISELKEAQDEYNTEPGRKPKAM